MTAPTISGKPLDCIGLPLDAVVGTHDFRPDPAGLMPPQPVRPAPPHPTHTPQEHAAIVRRMLNLALTNGTMHRQEALKALESLAEVERALVESDGAMK